jgi:hypothetical protein
MKLFLRKLTLFLMLQLGLWDCLLWAHARIKTQEQNYLSATIDKHKLLDERQSPRIVFVGGSNVAFDLDSQEIGKRLGYHAVNMGLKVSLGLDFMLNEVEPALRSGDVVVLFPEYDLFYDKNDTVAAESLFVALEVRPQNARYLSSFNLFQLLNGGYAVAGKVLTETINHHAYADDRNDPIRRGAFDEYGDLVVHRSQPPRSFEVEKIDAVPVSIDWAIDRLNRFNETCKPKGVRVFFSYPPTLRLWCDLNRDSVREIAAAVNANLKFPILNPSEETCLPAEDFFNTQYHLNKSGIEKHSGELIKRLSEAGVQVSH